MKYTLWALLFILTISLSAQDTTSFGKEVKEIVKRNDSLWNPSEETILFTGSSSIRFWKDLQYRFPEKQVLNSGFGGSQASDLLFHLNDLVLRYQPTKVFIYEGDNDIFAKKRPKAILETTEKIIEKLLQDNPNREVVLISAKPSLSRWNLRQRYKRLNKKMAKYADENTNIAFVDVWTPMLNKRKLKEDIFVGDGLHMNEKGYDIWYNTIKDFVE
ncbi:MAG: GDSL-type esterase/lipase family protein [Bacteroidota bacterium]